MCYSTHVHYYFSFFLGILHSLGQFTLLCSLSSLCSAFVVVVVVASHWIPLDPHALSSAVIECIGELGVCWLALSDSDSLSWCCSLVVEEAATNERSCLQDRLSSSRLHCARCPSGRLTQILEDKNQELRIMNRIRITSQKEDTQAKRVRSVLFGSHLARSSLVVVVAVKGGPNPLHAARL